MRFNPKHLILFMTHLKNKPPRASFIRSAREGLQAFAQSVNDPHKLHGPIFVVILFATAAMVFSQSAIFMVLVWKLIS